MQSGRETNTLRGPDEADAGSRHLTTEYRKGDIEYG